MWHQNDDSCSETTNPHQESRGKQLFVPPEDIPNPLRPMWRKETALRPNRNPVRTGTWSTMAESVLESAGIEMEIVLDMFKVCDLLSILRSF
jgi:hypothetical protein